MDTLDISDDENYLSCNDEMAKLGLNNSQENDGRIDPREFMPVPSMEFERLCPVVIDGETLGRQIKDYFVCKTGFVNGSQ